MDHHRIRISLPEASPGNVRELLTAADELVSQMSYDIDAVERAATNLIDCIDGLGDEPDADDLSELRGLADELRGTL